MDRGNVLVTKVPTSINASETSVLRGAQETGVSTADVFNLATTAGLNAVITRRLPKVAFLTTIGHRDILNKGELWRPFTALTDPSWRRRFGDTAEPIVPRYLRRGITERLSATGDVIVPLDEAEARLELERLRDCDVQGIAICLLHSYANPVHELRLRELVGEVLGDVAVSISSEVCPLAKEYPRASTTTIDVLMKLTYSAYTARLDQGLRALGFNGEFNYADCSARLMPASYAMERPFRLVVGGPAAGTIASAHFGTAIGQPNLLCADVGGTSCDISVVLDGQPWSSPTFEIEWDLMVNTISTEIVTLGAGGGSIVKIGGAGEVQVGPDSAGAQPGPACYARGGTAPTVTDAALLIGILSGGPSLGGHIALDPSLATQAFEQLDTSLSFSERVRHSWLVSQHNIAEGLLDITIRRGIDPRDFSLVAYGAAGPMTLPGVLDLVTLRSVIVPPYAGVFSALGLLSTDQEFTESRTFYGGLVEDAAADIDEVFRAIEKKVSVAAGLSLDEVKVVRTFDGRYVGQGWEVPSIPVPAGTIDVAAVHAMVEGFHAAYKHRNGHAFPRRAVEGVTYRVDLIVDSPKVEYPYLEPRSAGEPEPVGRVGMHHLYEVPIDALCYERGHLAVDDVVTGPAIIREPSTTTFVPRGRSARVGAHGELIIV
jgi:N-methylhydantoinase A